MVSLVGAISAEILESDSLAGYRQSTGLAR